jgi:cysteine-rich repeat protein
MCGDGIRIATEQCDSGIKPGCSAICKIVPGYTCTGDIGSISNCSIRCGDGILGGS